MASLEEGDMVQVRVQSRSILVCQVEGRYYAVDGLCSHAGQSLATGRLRGHQLSCPLHGARFDVRDGACLAAPAHTGLQTYPVIVDAGKVCVFLSTNSEGN